MLNTLKSNIYFKFLYSKMDFLILKICIMNLIEVAVEGAVGKEGVMEGVMEGVEVMEAMEEDAALVGIVLVGLQFAVNGIIVRLLD